MGKVLSVFGQVWQHAGTLSGRNIAVSRSVCFWLKICAAEHTVRRFREYALAAGGGCTGVKYYLAIVSAGSRKLKRFRGVDRNIVPQLCIRVKTAYLKIQRE